MIPPLPAAIADTPDYMILAGIMGMLAGACFLAVVALDVLIDRAERTGAKHATGRRSGRQWLLILAGVFLAVSFYHLVMRGGPA